MSDEAVVPSSGSDSGLLGNIALGAGALDIVSGLVGDKSPDWQKGQNQREFTQRRDFEIKMEQAERFGLSKLAVLGMPSYSGSSPQIIDGQSNTGSVLRDGARAIRGYAQQKQNDQSNSDMAILQQAQLDNIRARTDLIKEQKDASIAARDVTAGTTLDPEALFESQRDSSESYSVTHPRGKETKQNVTPIGVISERDGELLGEGEAIARVLNKLMKDTQNAGKATRKKVNKFVKKYSKYIKRSRHTY